MPLNCILEVEIFDVGFHGTFPILSRQQIYLGRSGLCVQMGKSPCLPNQDSRVVARLFKMIIFPRFGVCHILLSDNGAYFIEKKLEALLKMYGVHHKLGLGYYPQTSGQVEISNRETKVILEKRVARSRKDWVDKPGDALWTYRTTLKTPIGTMPFSLIYGKSCHLPIELEHKDFWVIIDFKAGDKKRLLQLNELKEIRSRTYKSSKMYKERMKSWHDRHIHRREFQEGDLVVLFNSRLKLFPGKLHSWWSGSFKVMKVYSYGAIDTGMEATSTFKVNGSWLKYY